MENTSEQWLLVEKQMEQTTPKPEQKIPSTASSVKVRKVIKRKLIQDIKPETL